MFATHVFRIRPLSFDIQHMWGWLINIDIRIRIRPLMFDIQHWFKNWNSVHSVALIFGNELALLKMSALSTHDTVGFKPWDAVFQNVSGPRFNPSKLGMTRLMTACKFAIPLSSAVFFLRRECHGPVVGSCAWSLQDLGYWRRWHHYQDWPETLAWKILIGTWSQTSLKMKINWLVVWLPFFIFPYIGNNHPNWLSYFSEGWPNHQPVKSGGTLVFPGTEMGTFDSSLSRLLGGARDNTKNHTWTMEIRQIPGVSWWCQMTGCFFLQQTEGQTRTLLY